MELTHNPLNEYADSKAIAIRMGKTIGDAQQMQAGRVVKYIEQELSACGDDQFFIQGTRELYKRIMAVVPGASTSYDDFKRAVLLPKFSHFNQAAMYSRLQSMVKSINWPQD